MIGTNDREGRRGAGLLLSILLVLAIVGSIGCVPASYATSIRADIRISDYDYLDDYGDWVRIPRYGIAWRPYVVAEWSPFFYGHWSWTSDGWAWISYEPYGWLVYHYGFWDYHPRFGWVWVPGTVWSPARVEWRMFGGYCAWAPMPPPHMYWPDPWDPWDIDVWIVVDINNFMDDNIGHYRVDPPRYREIARRGNVIKRAPAITRVEQITKRSIPAIKIEREPANVRREILKTPPKPGRPGKTPLRQIVLPEKERERIKEYAPKVEREVLTRKKAEAGKEKQQPEQQKESKKSETKEKGRRR